MKKNNKKGFTLVELVIVVAVMAVLVAVAIPTISSIKSTAETNVKASNAQTMESMIKLGEADGKYTLSTSIDATGKTAVETYINGEAQLGITGGTGGTTFYYDLVTGRCDTVATGMSSKLTITYAEGAATCTVS